MTQVHSAIEYGVFGVDMPIVRVSGEADAAAVPDLRACLHGLQLAKHPNVVVDLQGVTFLDSTALGVLVAASRHCRGLGGTLRLVISEPRVRRVLEITGLTDVFSVHRSLHAALHAP